MSAEARARIAEATRKRWVAKRAGNVSRKAVAKKATKRTISAEGRKRIADAARKRWAALRKAAKSA